MTYPAGPPLGFPNCASCPYLTSGPIEICISCAMANVPQLTGTRCPICAQSVEPGSTCRNRVCRLPVQQRGFGSVAAISVFSAPLDSIIKRFKYETGASGWSIIFGRLILGWLDRNAAVASQYDLILANPTHAGRQPLQHIETVLQAAKIEDIGQRWPIRPDGLLKTAETTRSAGHSWIDKQAAAQQHASAVATTVNLAGARILLFDDVFTSGAQLDAVGQRLRASGAQRVDGLVLARVPWSG